MDVVEWCTLEAAAEDPRQSDSKTGLPAHAQGAPTIVLLGNLSVRHDVDAAIHAAAEMFPLVRTAHTGAGAMSARAPNSACVRLTGPVRCP